VVLHDELLPFTRGLASDIAANDQTAVRTLLDEYKQTSMTTVAEGWDIETAIFKRFRREGFDPAVVAQRRASVIDRGRRETSGPSG